jgi:hypothetical protein
MTLILRMVPPALVTTSLGVSWISIVDDKILATLILQSYRQSQNVTYRMLRNLLLVLPESSSSSLYTLRLSRLAGLSFIPVAPFMLLNAPKVQSDTLAEQESMQLSLHSYCILRWRARSTGRRTIYFCAVIEGRGYSTSRSTLVGCDGLRWGGARAKSSLRVCNIVGVQFCMLSLLIATS